MRPILFALAPAKRTCSTRYRAASPARLLADPYRTISTLLDAFVILFCHIPHIWLGARVLTRRRAAAGIRSISSISNELADFFFVVQNPAYSEVSICLVVKAGKEGLLTDSKRRPVLVFPFVRLSFLSFLTTHSAFNSNSKQSPLQSGITLRQTYAHLPNKRILWQDY